MKVKLDHVLKDMEGESLKEKKNTGKKDKDGKPETELRDLTLGRICANALMTPIEKDTGDEKAQKGNLAMRIWGKEETELSIEELGLIKDMVGKFYGPLFVCQAWKLLEGE